MLIRRLRIPSSEGWSRHRGTGVGQWTPSRAGSALLGLIGAMLIVALLTAGLLTLFNTQVLQSTESSLSSESFAAAESGLSLGKAYVMTNLMWYTNLPRTITGTLGSASFSTFITNAGTQVPLITSTGTQDPTERTSIWKGNSAWNGPGGALARAIVVYRDNLTSTNYPRWRAYTPIKTLTSEMMALSNSAAPVWQRIAAHPRSNEFILASQDAKGRIYAQVCTNNIWGNGIVLNATNVAFPSCRSFDVTYENLSGRGMVAYNNNATNVHYRIWNGTIWSAEYMITNVLATTAVRWVRLVSKPGTNEIMCLSRWRGAGNYSSATVWNGSRWLTPQSLANNDNSPAAAINYEAMDAAYSSTTGLVVYINGGNGGSGKVVPRFQTWNGTAWSGELRFTAPGGPGALPSGGYPYWIRVDFNTNGTDAFVAISDNSSPPRLVGSHWTNGAWRAYNIFGTAGGVPLAGTYRPFDIAWGETTNALMIVYATNNATSRSYVLQQGSGSAVTGTTVNVASQGRWMVLKADPLTNEWTYVGLDSSNDVNVLRYSGSAWNLVDEIETDSNTNYCSIDMSFRADTNFP